VQVMNFDNTNRYTITSGTGGVLTVGDGSTGSISVSNGTHEIASGVAFAGNVAKSGAGTLVISGPQSHGSGAALSVNQGAVNLDSNAGTAGSAGGSNLSVSIGGGTARVNIGANQDLKALTVSFTDGGTQTLDLASPAGAGAFHSINVYAADLNGAKASLSAAIRNANGPGAADHFDGIIDSGLHSGAGIGIAIQGDHVTIRSTRVGDLNLDGAVTISDFIDLASNFNAVGKTWQEGDLNNDGSVTISDFIDLASNFNSTYTGTLGPISAEDQLTLASFASSLGVDPSVIGSAVPEPASLGLLAVCGAALLRRRRRSESHRAESSI
jgi:autotransporter-associated beta strand protein